MRAKLFSIELSDDAEVDFSKSYEFYAEVSPKVADSFFKQIKLSFEEIKQNPIVFPIAHKNIRKYIVKEFPFVIYYRIIDKKHIFFKILTIKLYCFIPQFFILDSSTSI